MDVQADIFLCADLDEDRREIRLPLRPELQRALMRCFWILRLEEKKDRAALAEEMVVDFLRKHGC